MKKLFFLLTLFGFWSTLANSQSLMSRKSSFTLVDSLGYLAFEFHESNLYAVSDLRKTYKKNYLQVFDTNGNVIKSCSLPGNFTILRKSQNNALFIGTTDTLYQVFYKNDTLQFAYPILTQAFNELNTLCFYQVSKYCFVEVKDFNKSIFELHGLYENNDGSVADLVLHTVVDTSVDAQLASANAKKSYQSKKRNQYTKDVNIIKNQRQKEEGFASPTYKKKRGYYSSYIRDLRTAMNFAGNRIYFFDYTNGKILQLSNTLDYIGTIEMESRSLLDNRAFHLIDFTNGNFYCILKKEGQFMLTGFDQETGKILNSNPLPEFAGISNGRVNNGRFYFLKKKNPTDSFEAIYFVDL